MVWLHMALMSLATVGSGDAVLLDFHADWCGPCRQMAPTIGEIAQSGYPVRKIDVDRDRALAERYRVQNLPCYIMVVDGREVDRVEGATSYGRLLQMFKKAEASLAKTESPAAPVTMPAQMPSTSSPDAALPPQSSSPLFASNPADAASASSAAPGWKTATTDWVPVARKEAAVSDAQLIAASVRLRIEDPKGHSCGSGTIIDARQDWALVLTCGHIFRDSNGKGRIEVDLFGNGAPQRVEGELVSYNMDRDVGLLKIRTPGPVVVAPVAPVGHSLVNGQSVISVGCNNGDDPTVERTSVRSRNQFAGPPNVEVDGLPVEGRSGGGLFTTDGVVVGVCNCADPTDNQGLYAAVASIHKELDEAGLAYVYQSPGGTLLTAASAPGASMPSAAQTELVSVAPPVMSPQMPSASDIAQRGESPLRPTAARSPGLTIEERAALEEIQRRKATGAEVVCIIRSRTDPLARSEIIVLNQASPEFLRRLADEGAHPSR